MKAAQATQFENEWQYKAQVKQQRKQWKTFRKQRSGKRNVWETQGA